MKPEIFVKESVVDAPAKEVFDWHSRLGALDRLSAPFYPEKIIQRNPSLAEGARTILKVPFGPFYFNWVSEHKGFDCNQLTFRDAQTQGPFVRFNHEHCFRPDGSSGCKMEDKIEYILPFGLLGKVMGQGYGRKKLERVFEYRHRVTRQDIQTHQKYSKGEPHHILVTGSSGSIGRTLVPFLTSGGHRVTRLVRSESHSAPDQVYWNLETGYVDTKNLEGLDAVVHLAGENIMAKRWTPERKKQILESRVKGTRLLCETLSRVDKPPKVLVSTSAIGYYGNRGDENLDEESSRGDGFLAEVCKAWEAATESAIKKGIRVVHLRIGIVLTPSSGALAQMLMPFRLGIGGPLGHGKQWMSWISIDDLLGSILHAIKTEKLSGPINAVAPNPVTNREFTRTLAHVLSRPAIVPIPDFTLRFIFGEIADEALLSSACVKPKKLLGSGYSFHHPGLLDALEYLLGRTK